MTRKKSSVKPFDIGQYLATSGVKKTLISYRKSQPIFSQGEKSGEATPTRERTPPGASNRASVAIKWITRTARLRIEE